MTWALINTVRARGLNPPQTSGSGSFVGVDLNVVLSVWSKNAGAGVEPTLSDFYGNTYTPLTAQSDGGIGLSSRLFYCQAPTVGGSFSITLSGAGSIVLSAIAAGFSGSPASPFDQQSGTGNTSVVTSLQPGSITATSGYLLVTGFGEAATGAISINSSFTVTDSFASDAATYYSAGLAYKVSTGAAENPTWSWSGNFANQQCAEMASFKTADVTVALTGVAATGSVGSITPTQGITGVAGTGSVGTVGTGSLSTLAQTGVAATGAAGNVAPGQGVSGTSGTGQVGTAGVSVTLALGGVAATGAAGTVAYSATGDVTLAIGGVSAIGQAGNVSAAGGDGGFDGHDPGLRKRLKKLEERRRKEFEAEAAARNRKRATVIAAFERVVEGKPEISEAMADEVIAKIEVEEIAGPVLGNLDWETFAANTDKIQALWTEFIERDDEEALALL